MAANDDMGTMITGMVLMSFALIVIPIAFVLFVIMGLLKPNALALSQTTYEPIKKKPLKLHTPELPKEEVLMMCPRCLEIMDRSDGSCSKCTTPLVAMDSWADQKDWS